MTLVVANDTVAFDPMQEATFKKLVLDLPFFAATCLKIRTKGGTLEPLIFNKAQQELHRRLEAQRREKGRVRAIVAKGRQQGISTYVQARYFHRTIFSFGIQAFILTHEDKATSRLFGMAETFLEKLPEGLRPELGAANAKELIFSNRDKSGYAVGTAKTKGTGRSGTFQLFHGSEVAYWPNAEDHLAGVLQTVPRVDGTEIILESTSNGMGNVYHVTWQEAEAGISEFIPVFLPWTWQPEYTEEPGPDFKLSAEEAEYQELHKVSLPQMAWRRLKVTELKSVGKFDQEYPATAALSFHTSGVSFIPAAKVMAARNRHFDESFGPRLLGVDPAGDGPNADRTAFCYRQGRKVWKIDTYQGWGPMAIAGRIKKALDEDGVDFAYIDSVGLGYGVFDRLMEMGYGSRVFSVNGGSEPSDKERFYNLRAEMWWNMDDWLTQEVDLPDEDAIQSDLCTFIQKADSLHRFRLETKDEYRSRLAGTSSVEVKNRIRSPDLADALALTFAYPPPARFTKPEDAEPDHFVDS